MIVHARLDDLQDLELAGGEAVFAGGRVGEFAYFAGGGRFFAPAYRATLLLIRWAQVKTALTFLHFGCTSSYTTCRKSRCFYGETMGKYGQSYGHISTTNNFTKLFVCQQIVEAYRATLLYTL